MRTFRRARQRSRAGRVVDAGCAGFVPALPGCFTRGDTLEECRENAAEAIAVHIAGLEADGEEVLERMAR